MTALRVLYVEDSERDAAVVTRHLSREGYKVAAVRVETAETLRTTLQAADWDVILSDYTMPGFNAISALAVLRETGLDIPFIILSGTIGEDTAVEAMLTGAKDYLRKDNLSRLVPAINRERRETENRRVRRQGEKELIKLKDDLQLAVQNYQRVLDNSLDVICQADESGQFTQVSAAAKKVWGYTPEELIANKDTINLVHPDDRAGTLQARLDIRSGHPTNSLENRYLRKDGTIAYMMWSANWSESDQTVFCVARDISEIKLAEKALQETEANYQNLIESSPAIVYLAQPFPPYSPIYVSPNIDVFGFTPEEWFSRPDMWISMIHEEDRQRVLHVTEDSMNQGLETELEYRVVARDGQIHWVQDKGRFISDEQGNKTGWQGVMLDITKTKELEDSLRQSQKLESVGLLAGGIAHDFNNMLTAINGYSDLMLRKLREDDPLRHYIEEIKKAGQRSAALTRQLLAFSRKQILQPAVVDINEIIADSIKILERLIGEDIEIAAILNPKVGRVSVDPGNFSQIIMNLAVNSRDAMPQGGKLNIETSNIFLDPVYAHRHADVLPGAYVMLAVSDTGTGMDNETKKHLFEPFFTTKEIGKGTGLGLATVYGIVKQSGGNIQVYSERGVGTTFKIFLPRVTAELEATDTTDNSDEMPNGTESILLVEDEELVRTLSKRILESCGYKITEARDGVEALELCENKDCQFDLLMTDVVMPRMGGRELAEKISAIFPDTRILFTSGYTDDAVVRHGVIEANTNFIQKPFSPAALAQKVREIFDNAARFA